MVTKNLIIFNQGAIVFIQGNDVIAALNQARGRPRLSGCLRELMRNLMSLRWLCSHTPAADQTKNVITEILWVFGCWCEPDRGRHGIKENIEGLKQRPHIIIGTPGRILDMLNKRHIKIEALRMLILMRPASSSQRFSSIRSAEIFKTLPRDIQVGLLAMTPDFFKLSSVHAWPCEDSGEKRNWP